MFYADELGSVI